MTKAPGYSPAARRFFEAHGISPAFALSAGVGEDGDELVYPGARRRSLNGAGPKVRQPAGEPLAPWLVLRGEGAVVICEGESDALAAGSALGVMPPLDRGDPGILSAPGTGCPPDRVVEAAREHGATLAYIATDADEAGDAYAAKLAEALSAAGIAPRRVQLPAGSDLADALAAAEPEHRGRVLAELLRGAVDADPRGPLLETGELLDRLVEAVRRYVVLSDPQCAAVALWVLHAHAIEAADSTPYLNISSPEKQSGKSRLLETLAQLVPRAMEAANVSDAALFRALSGDEGPATLLYDEVDALFGPQASVAKEEQRGLLNAGYRRGAVAWRCEGDGSRQTVTPYPVFGAKALAGIGELPETLADRSIPIRLRRRRPDEQVERGRYKAIVATCEPLKRAAGRWAERHVDALREADPDLPEKLSDRAQDGAEALLAIADLAGAEWPQRARAAVVELHAAERPEEAESWGVRLLADIRTAFGEDDRVSTHALIEELKADEEAPWASWGKSDSGLAPRALARLLAPYGIRSRNIREGGEVVKGYKREQFADAWDRYLSLDPDAEPLQRHIGSLEPKTPDSYPLQDADVADRKGAANPHSNADVAHVAAESENGRAAAASAEQEAEAERITAKFEAE